MFVCMLYFFVLAFSSCLDYFHIELAAKTTRHRPPMLLEINNITKQQHLNQIALAILLFLFLVLSKFKAYFCCLETIIMTNNTQI